MNEQKRPPEPPPEGAPPDTNPTGETPHGIPAGAGDHEPTGLPNGDRHRTETVPNDVGSGKDRA